ncbi:MAG: hypothetical protein HY738_06055 [Bacteroidia bacterium]|nr:hypothetical protein [Bacteroidia bacterium]
MEQQNNTNFSDNLDKLIELFKKLRAKATVHHYGFDETFISNIDFLINNYEMMKKNFPRDVMNRMGEPFHQMVTMIINQLKQELGEDYATKIQQDAEMPVEKKPDHSVQNIHMIDEMLKKPGLSSKEIDALLDIRANILAGQKENNI